MAAEACYQSAEIAKHETLAANIHAELGRGWIPFIAKAHHSVTEGAAIVEWQLGGTALTFVLRHGNNSASERNGAAQFNDVETDENAVLWQQQYFGKNSTLATTLSKVRHALVNCS